MYKNQAEAATTDMKTLEQLLKKFRQVVAERRENYYLEKEGTKFEGQRDYNSCLRKWCVTVYRRKVYSNNDSPDTKCGRTYRKLIIAIVITRLVKVLLVCSKAYRGVELM
jgi:DNA-binding protein H-NS